MSDVEKTIFFLTPAPASRFTHLNHLFNIKYDRVPKLKGTETYRAWRDTAELLLDALGLWDILTGKEQPPTGENEDDQQDYVDRKRNCVLFLFQTTDAALLPILTANKEPSKIWTALEKKFGMETTETFLAQFRDLFRLRLEDRNNLSDHLIFFETHLTRFQHRCAVE